jgi:diguanylate cyclase (GGDEF)-like protein
VDVQALAEKVRNTLQRELPQHREVVPFTVSIGVTTFRPEDQRVEDMMHRADIALYQAKAAGRDRVVYAGG